MKRFLEILDRVLGDSRTLSKTEFENKNKGKAIPIILNAPCVFNGSTFLYRGRLAKDVDLNEDLSSPATFSYVPLFLNKIGKPQMGRANYEGQSIFRNFGMVLNDPQMIIISRLAEQRFCQSFSS